MSNAQKSVIVTGGCSGIGLAMTRHFAAQPHQVTIFDLVQDIDGQDTASKILSEYPKATVTYKKCNVASWDEQAATFQSVYEEHGSIDMVMANAGISERGGTSAISFNEDTPSKPELEIFDVNLTGVVYTVKLATHYMNKKDPSTTGSRGSIICTASSAGLYAFPTSPL